MNTTEVPRNKNPTSLAPIGFAHWMALTAALLGWLFDGAEMGVFSMVGRRAIKDLLETDHEGTIGRKAEVGGMKDERDLKARRRELTVKPHPS